MLGQKKHLLNCAAAKSAGGPAGTGLGFHQIMRTRPCRSGKAARNSHCRRRCPRQSTTRRATTRNPHCGICRTCRSDICWQRGRGKVFTTVNQPSHEISSNHIALDLQADLVCPTNHTTLPKHRSPGFSISTSSRPRSFWAGRSSAPPPHGPRCSGHVACCESADVCVCGGPCGYRPGAPGAADNWGMHRWCSCS